MRKKDHQPDLFTNTTRNFSSAPTSTAAARAAAHVAGTQKQRILAYVREKWEREGRGATSDEIQRECGIPHSSSGRVTDLKAAGLLVPLSVGGIPVLEPTVRGNMAEVLIPGDGTPVAKPSRRRDDAEPLLRDAQRSLSDLLDYIDTFHGFGATFARLQREATRVSESIDEYLLKGKK